MVINHTDKHNSLLSILLDQIRVRQLNSPFDAFYITFNYF